MPMVPNMMGGNIRFAGIILGCCLWTAAPGCVGPRSGQVGHGWMAAMNPLSWSSSPTVAKTESADADEQLAATESKPELLPWRSRLKGYRLGARLARSRESDSEDDASETAEVASTRKSDSPTPAKLVSHESDGPSSDDRMTPSLENGELQVPGSVRLLPEKSRPDIVVD